jgi:ribA/ribD-fused uncharacterized protein
MIDSFSGRWRFLSNFHPCTIDFQGIKYPSVEHYYVAMKIKTDQQIEGRNITLIDCREMISRMKDTAKVKQLGKILKLRKDWELIKLDTMLFGVREKFKDEELRQMLLDTGDQELIEGNNWGDKFWGVCGGVGENHLGKILMKVREEVKQVDNKPSLEEFLFKKGMSK